MQVWIGCLACYNEGRLLGEWFEADEAGSVTPAQLHASPSDAARFARDAVLSPHEELWVMDVDEAPHPSLHREMSPAEAQRIADVLDALGRQHIEPDAFAAYVDHIGEDFSEDAIEGFEDAYAGTFGSREDFAMELADDLGLVPDEQPWPLSYIDWERAARDLFMDYFDAPAEGGRIYVFLSI